MQTANCIVCLAPACVWTGHVEHPPVLAGFCDKHKGRQPPSVKGCFGKWKPEHGVTGRGKKHRPLDAADAEEPTNG